MSKVVVNELIRLRAEKEVIDEVIKKAEDKLKATHSHKAGEPALVDHRPHTLKYVWVKYVDGIPELEEHFSRDPEWDAQKKEFAIWSPVGSSGRNIVYLDPLNEDELDELRDLNEQAEYGYGKVDSKTQQQELESRRSELLIRCGHVFKHDYRLFSDWESYTCEKCYLTYNSNDYRD